MRACSLSALLRYHPEVLLKGRLWLRREVTGSETASLTSSGEPQGLPAGGAHSQDRRGDSHGACKLGNLEP